MATNIPPHNLGEVIDATIHLIDQPRGHLRRPHAVRQGPRLPDRRPDHGPRRHPRRLPHRHAARSRCAAKAEIEEGPRGDHIVVTEMPVPESVEPIEEQDHRAGRTPASSRASRDPQRRVGGQDPPASSSSRRTRRPSSSSTTSTSTPRCRRTSRSTPWRSSTACPARSTCATRSWPTSSHQVEVITRRSEFRLDKARRRAHIVEGLLKALDLIDAIIAAIRASADHGRRDPWPSWPSRSSSPRCRPSTSSTCGSPRLTRLGRDQPRGGAGAAPGDHRRARGDPRATTPSCAPSSRTR